MKYTDSQLHELKARALFAQSNGIQLAGALDHLVVVLTEVLEHRSAACCQEEPKQEEPKQEEPKQEEPKQEELKQEEPKQEEPAEVASPLLDLVPPAPSTSPVLGGEEEAPEAPKPKGKKK